MKPEELVTLMEELIEGWTRAATRLDQAEKALKYLGGPKAGALLCVSPRDPHEGMPHIQVTPEHACLALEPTLARLRQDLDAATTELMTLAPRSKADVRRGGGWGKG